MEDNEAAVKHFERAAEVARSEGDENAATYKVRSEPSGPTIAIKKIARTELSRPVQLLKPSLR